MVNIGNVDLMLLLMMGRGCTNVYFGLLRVVRFFKEVEEPACGLR